jgi:hypothetical protein
MADKADRDKDLEPDVRDRKFISIDSFINDCLTLGAAVNLSRNQVLAR